MPSDLSPSNSLTEALQLDVGSSSQHCSRPILPNVFRCSIPPTWVVGPMPHAPCPIACMCLWISAIAGLLVLRPLGRSVHFVFSANSPGSEFCDLVALLRVK